MAERTPKIFIATPTAGQVHAEYCASLAAMVRHLQREGVDTEYVSVDGSPTVGEKRDWLVHRFLATPEATHLLFIDADMTFAPELASRLLGFRKDLIGTIYPRRSFDFEAYGAAFERGHRGDRAVALAHDFIFVPDENGKIAVSGDLCRVGALGTGFMLLSRHCLERLAPTVEKYVSFAGETVPGLFVRIPQPDGRALGHDYSFCRRWREAGGEVFAYIHARIWHCGSMRYGVPFDEYLKASFGHGNAMGRS